MRAALVQLLTALWLSAVAAGGTAPIAATRATPLTIGESFQLRSELLGETRRINVYSPSGFSIANAKPLPVLYMPDGGLAEDFLHIAGLLQVGVGNGTMRPWLLIGIENTERRRDLTGPTENAEDRKIAPRVGGAQTFRNFIRRELMPEIQRRYKTTSESAIIGESLAGLFVLETFLREPDLFNFYIAMDPSLWWNNQKLLNDERNLLTRGARSGKSLFVAASSTPGAVAAMQRFETPLIAAAIPGLSFKFKQYPLETHATIYHPAAVDAFRTLLGMSRVVSVATH